MIRIQLGADGLARSRFALSPVSETVNLLLAAANGAIPAPLRPRLRETIATRRLDLLAALLNVDGGAGHYIPDFLTPQPPRYEGDTAEELHAVATTPTWRVAGELAVAVDGELAKTVGRALPRKLTETDECETSELLAKELEQVWLHVLAPEWPRVRARMEADVDARLRVLGKHGFGAAIDTLDPKIDWHDGSVRLHGRFEVDVCEPALVFLPSVFNTRAAAVIDPVVRHVRPADTGDDTGDNTGAGGQPARYRRAAMLFYPIPRSTPG
ncbi:hypothetical protein, partial [Catenulispora rubra]|uniref:hypothetical protein n=1 Tax=Catenulispora rubra TaxID=280293 RepID=UPI001892135B